MKKTAVLLWAGLVFSCGQAEKDHDLTLSGEISGLKQGVLYVKTAEANDLKILDSVVFDGKSKYEINLKIDEPKVLYLMLNRGVSSSEDNAALIFAEPGKMVVNSSLDHFYSGIKVEGSASHELFQKYLDMKKALTDRQSDLIREQINARRTLQDRQADSLSKALENVQKRIYLNAVNFSIKNNRSVVAPYIALTDVAAISNVHLDSIHNHLDPEIKNSFYGKVLGGYLSIE